MSDVSCLGSTVCPRLPRQDVRVPHTVLYVPVPELEDYIRRRHEVEGPEWLSPEPDHLHAHITVLGPFVPVEAVTAGLDAELTALFASVEPFAFTLREIRVFPSGLVYLHPEPVAGFAALTAALVARYPAYPPYAGQFDPVPHLSLCAVGSDRDVGLVERELAGLLPARAMAQEVRLVAYAEQATRTLRSYPFGC